MEPAGVACPGYRSDKSLHCKKSENLLHPRLEIKKNPAVDL